jgi:hypothetical protein
VNLALAIDGAMRMSAFVRLRSSGLMLSDSFATTGLSPYAFASSALRKRAPSADKRALTVPRGSRANALPASTNPINALPG